MWRRHVSNDGVQLYWITPPIASQLGGVTLEQKKNIVLILWWGATTYNWMYGKHCTEKKSCDGTTLYTLMWQEPHLMIYWWFGQRWNCERQDPAVAVFVHYLLQKPNTGKKRQKSRVIKRIQTSTCITVPISALLYGQKDIFSSAGLATAAQTTAPHAVKLVWDHLAATCYWLWQIECHCQHPNHSIPISHWYMTQRLMHPCKQCHF